MLLWKKSDETRTFRWDGWGRLYNDKFDFWVKLTVEKSFPKIPTLWLWRGSVRGSKNLSTHGIPKKGEVMSLWDRWWKGCLSLWELNLVPARLNIVCPRSGPGFHIESETATESPIGRNFVYPVKRILCVSTDPFHQVNGEIEERNFKLKHLYDSKYPNWVVLRLPSFPSLRQVYYDQTQVCLPCDPSPTGGTPRKWRNHRSLRPWNRVDTTKPELDDSGWRWVDLVENVQPLPPVLREGRRWSYNHNLVPRDPRRTTDNKRGVWWWVVAKESVENKPTLIPFVWTGWIA